MTKHDLITQVGGIERAREILEGAPDGATHINPSEYYFKAVIGGDCEMWNPYKQVWFQTYVSVFDTFQTLDDLRTAIELSGISGQLEVLEMIHVSPSCKVIEK